MRVFYIYLCIVLAAVLFLTMSTGCSRSSSVESVANEQRDDDKQEVTIRFISSWGGLDTKADTIQQILDEFMDKNPHIQVINESMYGDDFLPKIKTDFASGNDPDVFCLWPGSDIKALIEAGKVADLTGTLDSDQKWKSTFRQEFWDYTTYDGKIYGLPLEIIYEGLFINKDLFDKYGIEVPETYEQLKKAIAQFKAYGIIPIAYNSLAEGSFLYQIITAALGGKKGVEQPIKDGKIDPCYVDAMYYTIELYQMGAFPSDAFTLDNTARNNLFINKKAAMIAQGSWFIGFLSDIEDTVDIIPFPSIDEEQANCSSLIYGLGNGVFYMSEAARKNISNSEASILLLKSLTSIEAARLLAENTGMLSNVDISDYDIKYGKLAQRGLELLENAKELTGPPDHFVDRSVWEEIIVKEFPYVLEGRKNGQVITPETVWEEAQVHLTP